MAPIFLPFDELMQLSQQALETYWEDSGLPLPEPQRSQHIATVHTILHYNLSSGRWKRAIERERLQHLDLDVRLQIYGLRVAAGYEQQHPRVHPLERGEREAWEDLRLWLEKSVRDMLRWRFHLVEAALQYEADECAQRACEIIYETRFPYDVAFDAWARCILLNEIRHRYRSPEIRRCTLMTDLFNPTPYADVQGVEMEEWEIPDPFQPLEVWELRDLLRDLMSHLSSDAQREVIYLTYFCDLADDVIAARLGKSIQAVYNLRNRAHNSLRRLLEDRLELLY